ILMVVIWTSGRVFAKFKLPSVLGEIMAGILIGPTVLGLIHETETVKVFAELGVFFLMFHAGLDTNPKELFRSSKSSILIACGGVIVLFFFGFFLMQLLGYPLLTSIFMGTITSVTSFPVITRVLSDLNLKNTKLGHTVLGATIVDDIIVFIMLSIVIAMAQTGNLEITMIIFILLKVVIFFLGTLFLGLKVLPKFTPILNKSGTKGFTFALIIALIFGLFAEIIGLHIILGAYLGGVFVRQETENKHAFNKIEDRFFGIAHSFLGPIFFASVGMAISFSVFHENPLFIFLLFSTIILGQWIGTGGTAYLVGKFSFREASAVAVSMSGRGVMEIIIATIGYNTWVIMEGETQERLLSQELFSAVVAVSILITFIMPFALKRLTKKQAKS
ncbi:cation:proton antiporter, partial [Candidatus Peregrinibacteria bacterium]|nr:cation:proton antiporter [Candidatus Peregrinibacteria bacterium]